MADIPTRKIIHCDCDCFYAAVEMRDDPSLRDKPVAVGGRHDRRGVVATCNYAARRFGIHSAMSMAQALRRCPDLVVIPPAMDKYRAASRQILDIYRDYTDLVEPLSLDEAYLDVTRSPHCQGSATLMAAEIRARIAATVGITASAGVAPNKFLAKIASDWNKPDGLFVIRPADIDAFVLQLPVKKLFGVGAVTAAKLKRLGAETCADLQRWPREALVRQFGRFGERLFTLCRGIDERDVSPSRERKSISVEETYAADLPTLADCLAQLPALQRKLAERMARAGAPLTIHKLFVKLKFTDFRQTTVECVASVLNEATLQTLMEAGYRRGERPVRLLGIGIRLDGRGEAADGLRGQTPLFDESEACVSDAQERRDGMAAAAVRA